MSGIELMLLGKVISQAADPLLRVTKRALARRGFGKTQLYEAIEEVDEDLASVSTLSIVHHLPHRITDRAVAELLASPKMLQLTRILLSAVLVKDDKIIRRIEGEMYVLFRDHFSEVNTSLSELRQYVGKLYEQIRDQCTRIGDKFINRSEKSSEVLDWAYKNVSNAYIRSISRSTGEGVPYTSTIDKMVEGWLERYRTAFDARHRRIDIPDLASRRQIDYSQLYVGCNLSPLSKQSKALAEFYQSSGQLTDQTVLALADRVVILGDPGAGKSTTSSTLALRAWDELDLIPFVIIMKDIQIISGGFSLVDHIVSMLAVRYECSIDKNTVERILVNGRAFLVFDGLDELLNGSTRLEAVRVIEVSGGLYPLTRMVVTSRRIGYSIARLNSEIFDELVLDAFNTHQVQSYVQNWFSLQDTIDEDQVDGLVADFMKTSESLHDLRTNPLLLAFICVLYRGHRHIPRRRAELYRKSVELLLTEWDQARGISREVPDFDLYELVLTRLAYLIVTETGKANGILTEHFVYEIAVPALIEEEVPTERMARKIVKDLLKLCRGRAWVFNDVGLDEHGRDIFSFTHTSFVEYFAARHITRSLNSPEEVADILIPEISVGRWEVLAQICLALQRAGSVAGGARIVSKMLASAEAKVVSGNRTNARYDGSLSQDNKLASTDSSVAIVDFLMRVSDTLPVNSDVMARLVRLLLENFLGGKSRTFASLFEDGYRHRVEAAEFVKGELDARLRSRESLLASSDAGNAASLFWLTAHLPYISRVPSSYQVSGDLLRKLYEEISVPDINWFYRVATDSDIWRVVGVHSGRIGVLDSSVPPGRRSPVEAYADLFSKIRQPIPGFGPDSSAHWIVECLGATDALSLSSRYVVALLRQIGKSAGGILWDVSAPPPLRANDHMFSRMRKVSAKLHGYGTDVVRAWLGVCLGFIEIECWINGTPRQTAMDEICMQDVYAAYCANGVLGSNDLVTWLTESSNVWLVDNHVITG